MSVPTLVFRVKWHIQQGMKVEVGKCRNASYQALSDLRELTDYLDADLTF